MPSFTWNDLVPFSTNNPSDDQPKMLTNTQSTKLILNQDHFTFESSTAAGDVDGWHRRVYIPVFTDPVPTVPFVQSSAIYTGAGSSSGDVDRPLLSFINDRGSFALSGIRAMGTFIGTNVVGPVTMDNSFNVDSAELTIALPSRTYVITLKSDVVIGTNAAVIASSQSGFVNAYMSAANTVTLNTSPGVGLPKISFTVLQV